LSEMIRPGEVVALLLPNSIEFHVAYFGALKALALPALLNPMYPEPQLFALLREIGSRALLCSALTEDLASALAKEIGIPFLCLRGDVAIGLGAVNHRDQIPQRVALPDTPAVLLFSGGTTGVPKAVEHTHSRLVTAVHSANCLWPMQYDDVFLPVAPFTHVYGFIFGILVPLAVRGETVVPERFKPEHIVETLADQGVTIFGGPTGRLCRVIGGEQSCQH
jgi:long-chain acyl-CoA synthetase